MEQQALKKYARGHLAKISAILTVSILLPLLAEMAAIKLRPFFDKYSKQTCCKLLVKIDPTVLLSGHI